MRPRTKGHISAWVAMLASCGCGVSERHPAQQTDSEKDLRIGAPSSDDSRPEAPADTASSGNVPARLPEEASSLGAVQSDEARTEKPARTARSREAPEAPEQVHFSADEMARALEEAYRSSSADALSELLDLWHRSVLPRDLESIKDPVIRDVYDVYLAFYDPFDLARLGDFELGNDSYADAKYVVIQYVIRFRGAGDQAYPLLSCTLRPPVRFEGVKALCLKSPCGLVLDGFLGSESIPMGTGNLMSPARPKGESERRLAFLNQYLKICHGHWGGWHLETHPFVDEIEFNEDRTQATVRFRPRYQGGEALLVKGAAGWELRESRSTWIE